jgi:hypothetical protein
VALAALLAVGAAAVGAIGAAGDRPGAGAGFGGMAFAVQLDHDLGAEGRVVLGPPHPLGQLAAGPGAGGDLAVVERHKHRVKARRGWLSAAAAGGVDRALADGLGFRAGMPSPRRAKALRSDGQVVPSSASAALTLPSHSASWKARSASARSARKRLGCQPSGWRSSPLLRFALGSERVLSESDVQQYAATARMWLRPAA